MIVRPEVFDNSHLPRKLRHRGAEVDQLARAVEPTMVGKAADDALIWGPSGVGKTALARHTLHRLESQSEMQHAHVACLGQTTAGIIRSILGALTGSEPASNTPLEDLCLALCERITSPTIVILDEAEELPETDALDRLADVEGLSMIVICHTPSEWLARVPDDISHRLVAHKISVSRLGVDELTDILEDRARVGLEDGIVVREQLEYLADDVAGEARAGIQSTLAAAKIAQERGHQQVRDPDIEDAYERALVWIRKANLDSLPFHHHVLYEVVRELGPITGPALQDHYDRIADDVYRGRDRVPVKRRARRDKLRKLQTYDLVESEGRTKGTVYFACDPSVRSPYDIKTDARDATV